MALRRNSSAIPEGAVALTEQEAVQHQWKIISNWEPSSDVWPLKHGMAILALSSAATAMYINKHYRKMLKLGRVGLMISYLPTVAIPAIASTLFHQQGVLSDILIMKSECPVCVQIRSSSYQAFFGSLYPTALAPLATFLLASRYYTYDVPSLITTPKETLKLWLKLTRPLHGFLVAAAFGQALVGSGLAYMEMKSILKVNRKMMEMEEQGLESENFPSELLR